MNFVRFARRGCSRAVAQIAARRRLAVVCSAVLAAGLAGAAFTAVPASAAQTGGICLDADAGQVYDFGAIIQWTCNPADPYQNWIMTPVADTSLGEVYEIQNAGALDGDDAADCLYADGQPYNGGAVIQWGCNASDPWQLWLEQPIVGSIFRFESYGELIGYGVSNCLDADGSQVGQGGPIFQWSCAVDTFQYWGLTNGYFGMQFQNLGASGIP